MANRPAARDRVESLVRATPELIELQPDQVLQRVADLARELLEARYVAVGLLAADGQSLMSFTTSGIDPADRDKIGHPPTGKGVLGQVIREGQVVRLSDLSQHPASVGFPPNHPPMHSFLGVPVVGRQGVLGELYLAEKIAAAEFSDDDVHIALLLANVVASAMENARNHERTARLLDEVQQLHRSRERFFAMVNHELRNSLAAVYGWAEMLVRRKDRENVPRGAYEILEAAEQSVALLNDLLDLHRIDEDRLKIVLKEIDCGSVVGASIQRVAPSAGEKRVRVIEAPRANRIVSRTDAHRVEQILVNLLSNAIRHAPEDSTVTVAVKSGVDEVSIEVADEGPGVSMEAVDRIFDIYYTTAGQDRMTGHGVGLALSRKLARLLGGELTAIATGGKGGLFVLTLPSQIGEDLFTRP